MAVYTEISDGELTGFLAQYDLGEVLSCKGIAEGIENSNYLLRTQTGTYILTIYEKRVRREDLPFFLGLMDHLVLRRFPCAAPIRGRDGESLREVAGKPAAIVSFLDGVSLRRPGPEHCGLLGEAMARLHLATADFEMRRTNGLSLAGWRPLFESCAARADQIEAGLETGIAAELDYLEAKPEATMMDGNRDPQRQSGQRCAVGQEAEDKAGIQDLDDHQKRQSHS